MGTTTNEIHRVFIELGRWNFDLFLSFDFEISLFIGDILVLLWRLSRALFSSLTLFPPCIVYSCAISCQELQAAVSLGPSALSGSALGLLCPSQPRRDILPLLLGSFWFYQCLYLRSAFLTFSMPHWGSLFSFDCPLVGGIVLNPACDTVYYNVKEHGLESADLGLNPSFVTYSLDDL